MKNYQMQWGIYTVFRKVLYFIVSCLSSYVVYISSNINVEPVTIKENNNDAILMQIKIPSINLSGNIYEKNSKSNDINKNIVLMNESSYPDEDEGVVIIGAHSGIGKIAYFRNLNKLNISDEILIYYDNIQYKYSVKNIYLDVKDGSIIVNNYNKKRKLYLYTCNPGDKSNYLVVVAEQKIWNYSDFIFLLIILFSIIFTIK